jgi:hypothetical protein
LRWFIRLSGIEHLRESGVAAAAGSLAAAVDSLLTLDLARLDRDELLALTRGLEAQRRRLPGPAATKPPPNPRSTTSTTVPTAVTPTSTASPSPATGTTTKPPTKAGSPP